jgi:glyoxylase-like metal-dependent hydrolase (beta-lactamase superfamily II)
MKRYFAIAGAAAGMLVFVAAFFAWNTYRNFMSTKIIRYDSNLTIVLGGGGNSIVLTSEDGAKALVVDTKMGSAAQKLAALAKAPEITVVNTHFHADHTGGNGLYPAARFIAGAYSKMQWLKDAGKIRYPDEAIEADSEKILAVGSEIVHIRNMGRAHTWDDVAVYLEKRKVLVTGDIVFLGRHPVLFARSGANVASWMTALDTLQKLYDPQVVIPGHGPVADKKALSRMREYFTLAADAAENPERRTALREKYGALASIPGMSGSSETIRFIEREKKER